MDEVHSRCVSVTVKRSLQLVAGVSIAALFLWLTLRNMEPRDMRQELANARPRCLALAFVAVMIGYSCRIERWRLMLTCANPRMTWSACGGPLLASFAANNVLPFRAGDVMRAFAFNSSLGATAGVVLATVVVERLLDVLINLGLLGVALTAFDINSARVIGTGGALLMGLVAAVLVVLFFPRVVIPVMQAFANYTVRVLPRFGRKVAEEVIKSQATLEYLGERGRMAVLVFWSMAAWLSEGCAFWLTALAFPSLVKPLGAWLALPVSAFATLVPSTPGYVGTFDYFTVLAMTTVGNDVTGATVYAFFIHVVVWLPSTVAGGAYLLHRWIQGKDQPS